MLLIGGGYKRLIIIYLLFDVVYLAFDYSVGGLTVNRLLRPSFHLWYILSLIFWRLFLQLIPQKILDYKIVMMVVSFAISLAVGFVPISGELSFQRTFVYWPFFLIGYYIKQTDLIGYIRGRNMFMATIICVTLVIATYCYIPVMYSNVCYCNLPSDFIIRALQLLVASVLCGCFLIIGKEELPILTELGKYTLMIYLLHPPLVKIMKMICIKLGHTPNVLSAIVITAVSVALIYSVRNLKILKYIK